MLISGLSHFLLFCFSVPPSIMELIIYFIFPPLKPGHVSGCLFGFCFFCLDSDWCTPSTELLPEEGTVHGTAYNRTPSGPMELSRETQSGVVACYSLRIEHEEESTEKARAGCFSDKGNGVYAKAHFQEGVGTFQ